MPRVIQVPTVRPIAPAPVALQPVIPLLKPLPVSPQPIPKISTVTPITVPTVTPIRMPALTGVAPIPAGIVPPLPAGAKLYCSPLSVVYNTGSICFNPDLETIDSRFYPWSLYGPPLFVNAPGFTSLYPPGLLIHYCPQCAFRNTQRALPLFGALSAPDAASVAPQPKLPSKAPRVEAKGPLHPLTELVLKDGTTWLVTRYWLGQDWLLHFVTINGERKAIPLGELNLDATGSVNYQHGVEFLLPAWPEPRKK